MKLPFSPQLIRIVSLNENGISDNKSCFTGREQEHKALKLITTLLHFLYIVMRHILCGTSKALIILITCTIASRKAP